MEAYEIQKKEVMQNNIVKENLKKINSWEILDIFKYFCCNVQIYLIWFDVNTDFLAIITVTKHND